jgi:hypothetical protein
MFISQPRRGRQRRQGATNAELHLARPEVAMLVTAMVQARGLATATPQRIRAGGKVMEVAVLRITEAGQRANRGS